MLQFIRIPMPSTRLSFQNAEGNELAARLESPEGKPAAYALFAHCFTCSKDLRVVRRISEALTSSGIAVLAFDFTGLGESEGDFKDTSFSTSLDDLVRAAKLLDQDYEAPQLLMGHSLGGAAALAVAEQLPSVKAVATIGAPCNPRHVEHLIVDAIPEIEASGEATVSIGGRPFCIRKQFVDDLGSQEAMRGRISRLGRALLIFHSPQDQTVDIEQAAQIYKAAKHPKSFVSLDGADHLVTDASDARYVADVLAAWASRYLATSPTSESSPLKPSNGSMPNYSDSTVRVHTGASGFRTTVNARGFEIFADEPASAGGTEAGPTPYDFIGVALGACTSMTLRMYADRKQWPLEGVTVHVSHDRIHAADCADCESTEGRLDRLSRSITLEGPLDDVQKARMLEIADRCPVHKTLHSEIVVETKLAY